MATKINEKNQGADIPVIQLTGAPDKQIPKYSSNVYYGLREGNVILTFTYKDSTDQPEAVIERIAVDINHATKIAEAINTLIQQENVSKK